ncbi:MAG: pyruvate kinase, partial [Planctomycetota bacterium]
MQQRTKIVATIGPASRAHATLARLVDAGMDVARLNLSHGTHDEHREVMHAVREIAEQKQQPVAILLDLCGPKVRVGAIREPSVTLVPGQEFTLTTRAVPGSERAVSVSHATLPAEVQAGDPVLLSDGAIELEVIATQATDIVCRVIVGGALSSHKGLNLPTRTLQVQSLTDKDRRDLEFGITHGVDFVALSFVRSGADVQCARQFLQQRRSSIPLIAKIEKHEALDHLDAIIALADGVMVARGDLGVDVPLERVPRLQKELIARANRAAKPVITATQMLRSMVDNPRPTRAEVTDVANAILDGTDAVMLSEETAAGRYPADAVAIMARIAAATEASFPYGRSALDPGAAVTPPE